MNQGPSKAAIGVRVGTQFIVLKGTTNNSEHHLTPGIAHLEGVESKEMFINPQPLQRWQN